MFINFCVKLKKFVERKQTNYNLKEFKIIKVVNDQRIYELNVQQ